MQYNEVKERDKPGYRASAHGSLQCVKYITQNTLEIPDKSRQVGVVNWTLESGQRTETNNINYDEWLTAQLTAVNWKLCVC